MKRTLAAIVSLLAAVPLLAAGELNVLCSTFPIYQLTRNVVAGREGVSVALLIPAALGCPHHYALTPRDMRRLERADVLVVNGLGLEEFLGAPVRRANPDIRLIDSAAGISGLLHDHAHDHDHEHATGCANPHLFVSPLRATQLVANIAAGLSAADPGGALHYARNAEAYAGRLLALHEEMVTTVAGLENRRIVQPHGVFDYLARDIGLDIVAVLQPHGQSPSAAEMLRLVRRIRDAQAGAVFTEPQYADDAARTIAREIGIDVAQLDPAESGPADAPLDYYEQVMQRNIATLKRVLGDAR